jgi:TfoX/Sxy family transcriptional regulator of competence genes
MASDQSFMDYVCDQMRGAGHITFKKMFGEYAVYCERQGQIKVVAFVCDNQCFLKITEPGLREIARFTSTPLPQGEAYPGSKPYVILDSALEDQEFVTAAVIATYEALPLPKPKTAKPKAPKANASAATAVKPPPKTTRKRT